MTSSLETHWQSQLEGRRRLIKLMLLVLLTFLLSLVVFWFWITQPLLFKTNPSSSVSIDPARLETHVRALSEQLGPRDESHPENLDRVAAYIRTAFESNGAIVSEQPYTVEARTFRNLIAQFGPETDERIIVGAHYDTAGPLPGADDNASGVAGLIELSQLLSRDHLPMPKYECHSASNEITQIRQC
jgi:hypothetical protein